MRAHSQGVRFSFDMKPFMGYGSQNDHNFSNYIADALDLHLEDPFPLYHVLDGGDEAMTDIRDRMRSFAEVGRPGTILFIQEIPVIVEVLGAVRERSRVALETGELGNPYSALCTGAMRTLIAALQTRISEEPIEPPRYPSQ